MRTRVKICGLTRAQDIHAAVQAGTDAVGLVFVPGSSRALTVEQGALLRRSVPAFVQTVALLKDPSVAEVEAVITQVQPDLLQFHGSETGADCTRFNYPYIKALSASHGRDALLAAADEHPSAHGFLVDSHVPGGLGGTGHAFDWSDWPGTWCNPDTPFILAGGLHPDNIARAIAALNPYAVDVSSGVESAAGQKSPEKIQQFMRRVRHD